MCCCKISNNLNMLCLLHILLIYEYIYIYIHTVVTSIPLYKAFRNTSSKFDISLESHIVFDDL